MRADHARSGIVGVSGSGRWCSHRAVPRNHGCCHWCPRHGVPRNHRCCHWRPRHALSPSNHVPSTIMNFPPLVPILILLSDCINSSSLFPVAILCTLLHRENTSFEVWHLHTPVGYSRPPSAVNDPSVTKKTNSKKSCPEDLFQILVLQVTLFYQYLVHLHDDFHRNKESTKNLANSTMKKKKKNSVLIVDFCELFLLFVSIAAR